MLTDGVVTLRHLVRSNAEPHLTREDEALQQWLNGGEANEDDVTVRGPIPLRSDTGRSRGLLRAGRRSRPQALVR